MLKIFNSDIFNRTICLLLALIFLSTFPAGKTSLAFCLDDQESHLVGQKFYLADCHSLNQANRIISDEQISVHAGNSEKDCTDVSLINANIINRPSQTRLPIASKVFHSYTLPNGLIRTQQKVEGFNSTALYQPLFIPPNITDRNTVVLLIVKLQLLPEEPSSHTEIY